MSEWQPIYSPWRHGGWYVNNVRYPNGAIGCVSRNYPDKKWRIVCDDRREELDGKGDFTYPNRDAAARAERELANRRADTVTLDGWRITVGAKGRDLFIWREGRVGGINVKDTDEGFAVAIWDSDAANECASCSAPYTELDSYGQLNNPPEKEPQA
jgi:hypothetical protein